MRLYRILMKIVSSKRTKSIINLFPFFYIMHGHIVHNGHSLVEVVGCDACFMKDLTACVAVLSTGCKDLPMTFLLQTVGV